MVTIMHLKREMATRMKGEAVNDDEMIDDLNCRTT
jgi:hypothetical protein